MRAICAFGLVVLGAIGGCKGHKADPGSTGSASGSALPQVHPDAQQFAIDWTTCEVALRKAATEPLDARPQIVIDGCKVCGDWMPILRWNTLQIDKGPTRLQIDNAMFSCGAYCNADAKQRFLGALDDTRGGNTRTPWRLLGEVCKGEVSAVPDNRFTTAPLFALDRIARAASKQGGQIANLAQAIELPLPAVSLTGNGIVIPDLDGGVAPIAGPIAITIIGESINLAKLPRAHLGATGVIVDLGGYPGAVVKLADLGAALTKLANGDQTMPIAILAPYAMPAESLVELVATASKVAPVYLAANAAGAPEGWALPGTIALKLEAAGTTKTAVSDALAITPEMTVQNLATELAKRAHAGQREVGLSHQSPPHQTPR